MLHSFTRFSILSVFLWLLCVPVLRAQYTFAWQKGAEAEGLLELASPGGLAVDKDNNLYIPDSRHRRIVKCDASGKVLLKFGTLGAGQGELDIPTAVALDAAGNIYVADQGRNAIVKFNAQGQFLFQFGSSGTEPGRFQYLTDLVVDAAGNIYACDSGNHRIQLFNSSGVFLRALGKRGSGEGEFLDPRSITLDAVGNLYVAEAGNNRVQKFDASGRFLWKIGELTRSAMPGKFNLACDVATDAAGNLYVADQLNHRVQKFTKDGQFTEAFGSFDAEGNFLNPGSLVIDGQGSLSVAADDYVYKYNTSRQLLYRIGEGDKSGHFREPAGATVDADGNVYVVDLQNHRVQKFDPQGNVLLSFGSIEQGSNQMVSPRDVAVASWGRIYVAEGYGAHVFDADGNSTNTIGSYGDGVGEFHAPRGVAVDEHGNFYVVDHDTQSVQKFDLNGNFIWKMGTYGTAAGQFRSPAGVAVDSEGNLYVADGGNTRIQKFNAQGEFIMSFGASGSGDERNSFPLDIALDTEGNIYVSDDNNHRVQVFNQDGVLIRKVGSYGKGPGEFFHPNGVAVDKAGNLYVSDTWNHRLQKFTPEPEVAVLAVAANVIPIENNAGSFDLGSTRGDFPLVGKFIISNSAGARELHVGNLQLPAGFVLDSGSVFPSTIPAGEQRSIRIKFVSSQLGTTRGTVSFTSNDPDEQAYTFAISATLLKPLLAQEISYTPVANKTYGDAPFLLSATASSGLPVSYTVDGPADLAGSTLTITGAGLVTIFIDQDGNEEYKAARSVSLSFTVYKASQTIGFTLADRPWQAEPVTLAGTASSGLLLSYLVVSGPASVSGNALTLTGAGQVTVRATQAGDSNYKAAPPVERSFTVTTSTNTKLSEVTGPVNGATGVSTSPVLVHKLLAGASLYTVELNTKADFTGTALLRSSTNQFTNWTGLVPGTTYFVRVKTNLLPNHWGPATSFTTVPVTTVSQVVNPVNGATGVSTSPVLVHMLLPGASLYTVELNTKADFTGTALLRSNSNQFTNWTGLLPGTTYFARVKTNLLPNHWGPTTSFTTVPVTTVSQVSNPANGATGVSTSPMLIHKLLAGASLYTVELNTKADFTGTALLRSNSNQYTHWTGLLPGTTYFARVRTNLLPDYWGPTTSFTTLLTATATARVEAAGAQTAEKTAWQATLYPNPASERLVVALNIPVASIEKTAVVDALGNAYLMNTHQPVDSYQLSIGIGTLKPGMYLLWLQTAEGRQVLKFIKQ
jgi:DNA-binding beta-propeller fold protein YncE